MRCGPSGSPSKHAALAQVSTVWPTRSTARLPRSSGLKANNRTATPGRPSGVASGGSSASMPASTLQPITEVAKPVSASAAVRAQRGETAVITSRVAHMSNASA